MNAAPELEQQQPDDEIEDEEPELARSSFFADGDDADERVCETVWTLFVRDSLERGFAQHGEPGLRTKKTHFNARSEKTMSESVERVKEAHARLSGRLERAPSVQELFAEVGEDVGRSVNNVRGIAKRLELALLSLRGKGGKGGGASAVPKTIQTTAKKRGPRVHVVPREPHGANGAGKNGHANGAAHDDDAPPRPPRSGHPGAVLAIMALQTERTKLAAELAAIDGLIDRMRR